MKRLKNLKTTIPGVIIFAFAMYLLYVGKVDVIGFSSMVALSGLLVRAKDTIIGFEEK